MPTSLWFICLFLLCGLFLDSDMFYFKKSISGDSIRMYSFSEHQTHKVMEEMLQMANVEKMLWSRLTHSILWTMQ